MEPQSDPSLIRGLFDRAALLDDEGRRALIEEVGFSHPEVAEELEGMLRHHVREDGLLDRSPIDAVGLVDDGFVGGDVLAHEREHGVLPEGASVGEYVVRRVIGTGGSSVVYEAVRAGDGGGAPVALKVVRPELVTEAMVGRFERAAAGLKAVEHPGIARVLDVGVMEIGGTGSAGGRPCVVSELVFGPTLPTYVQAAAPSMVEKLKMAAGLCDALEHAHARGIHHGALSPAHVRVVQATGTAKLIDVGWSGLMTEPGASSSGKSAQESAAQADIYALGEITHELLTGHRPRMVVGYESAPGFVAGLGRGPVVPPSRSGVRISQGLDAVVLCALAPDPARRYRAAAEMGADIRRLLARPELLIARDEAHERRRRTWQLALISTIAVVIGLGARMAWEAVRGRNVAAPSAVPVERPRPDERAR